ncbi:hypothetical protein BRD17_04895 [Halobacteriales archaeon SW_7_68_16]|nr:MAG: hypothetical protein BRD17_04895 [Halobacteriales archaeon SW_7_68_16]
MFGVSEDRLLPGDRRAVSVTIGAVLIFAVAFLGLALFQATAVPAENAGIELEHGLAVQDSFADFRTAVIAPDGARRIRVPLGANYPVYAFNGAFEPGGRLRTLNTTDPAVNTTIQNASATGAVGDFWNGSPRTYGTGALVFRPLYGAYESPPTVVYEDTVVYNELPDDTTRGLTEQGLVDGRTIRLATVGGSVSEFSSGRRMATLRVRRVGVDRRSIGVTGDGGRVTILTGTRLSTAEWRSWLAVELARDRTYRLAVPRVRVSVDSDAAETVDTDPAYLVPTGDGRDRVVDGGRTTLTVEIRDRFNGLVGDQRVNLTVVNETDGPDGRLVVGGRNATTIRNVSAGGDGRLAVDYRGPEAGGDREVRIRASYRLTPPPNATASSDDGLLDTVTELIDPATGEAFDADRPEDVVVDVEIDDTGR